MATNAPHSERDLLTEIGVPADIAAPNCFDMLLLPPDCEDDALIRRRVREQSQKLKKWEQYRPDPAVQKMATAMLARIADAGRRLKNSESRARYHAALQAQQGGGFREQLRSVVKPGQELSAAHLEQLITLARSHGLDDAAAREIIAEATRQENPYAVLRLTPVPDDESWPTAFDLLGLEESEKAPTKLQQRVDVQLQRIEAAADGGQLSPHEANELRKRVEEAGRTLAAPDLAKAYLRALVQHRAERFAAMVNVAIDEAGKPEAATLIQLVQRGRRLRLKQHQLEKVIARVTGVDIREHLDRQPVLHVGRADIEAFVRGDGTGAVEVFSVGNEGTGTLEATLETSDDWISVSETTVRTDTRRDVQVVFRPSQLWPAEPRTGEIRIRSNGGETQVRVTATLGQPGVRVTPEDYAGAGRAYLWGLANLLFFGFVALIWKFMMTRKESPFQAFHAMQAFCMSAVSLGVMFTTMYLVDPKGGGPGGTCFGACLGILLFFFVWLGVPILMYRALKAGRNVVFPGLAGLLRRAL